MANEITNIVYDVYKLKETDDPVNLTATIGYAQDGNTIVKLSGKKIGEFGNEFTALLGPNNKLDGKELRIASLVTDIKDDCNIVSIHIVLTGGLASKDWTLIQDPTEDNQSYPLTATIGLYK